MSAELKDGRRISIIDKNGHERVMTPGSSFPKHTDGSPTTQEEFEQLLALAQGSLIMPKTAGWIPKPGDIIKQVITRSSNEDT